MSYSEFDLQTAQQRFGLVYNERSELYPVVNPVEPSAWLREVLDHVAPGALMALEKARSEFIIAPILLESVRLTKFEVRLFSGVTFNVDPERGLHGVCDFILTRSPERLFIRHPVLAVVEAKREDIGGGLGPCVAELVAAQEFNARAGSGEQPVHGVVTTGINWHFLRLQDQTVDIDLSGYHLRQVSTILGILTMILSDQTADEA